MQMTDKLNNWKCTLKVLAHYSAPEQVPIALSGGIDLPSASKLHHRVFKHRYVTYCFDWKKLN